MPDTTNAINNPQPPVGPEKSLYLLRHEIIHDLAAALASASRHLSLHLAGQSDFHEPDHLKTTLATLKYLPHLIDLLPTKEPDPDTEPPNPLLQKLIAQHIYDRKDHTLTPIRSPAAPSASRAPAPTGPTPAPSASPATTSSASSDFKVKADSNRRLGIAPLCRIQCNYIENNHFKNRKNPMISQNDLTSPNGQLTTDNGPALTPISQNFPPFPNSNQTQCQSDAPTEPTDPQQAAIKLLLAGQSFSHIAESLGITRRTLYNWRLKDPLFRSELARRREDLYGQASDRYRNLLNSAMNTLERQVNDKYNPTSHRAARTLLSLSRLPHHLFPTPDPQQLTTDH